MNLSINKLVFVSFSTYLNDNGCLIKFAKLYNELSKHIFIDFLFVYI